MTTILHTTANLSLPVFPLIFGFLFTFLPGAAGILVGLSAAG